MECLEQFCTGKSDVFEKNIFTFMHNFPEHSGVPCEFSSLVSLHLGETVAPQSLLYNKCKYTERMTTDSCFWSPIPGIHVCGAMREWIQQNPILEKKVSFSAGYDPFLTDSMVIGTLGKGRMNCCGEWTGQVHLEVELVSARVTCWLAIRVPS